jgi:recombinational DNA repair protein RecT
MNKVIAKRPEDNGQMTNAKPAQVPARAFRDSCTKMAASLLSDWVGDARAKEAAGRVASALSCAASAARDPSDFYNSTPQSVGAVIAISALTGIMPSTGASALAYAVPRRARKGEAPQLQYMLSHRGLNALARRCGSMMIAVPISHDDSIRCSDDGEIEIVDRDIDNPPVSLQELRGVVVIVKDIKTGMVLTRGWVPMKLIEARKKLSLSAGSDYGPWNVWPVEMAMKTAMHYAVSRGWCVIDDNEAVRALSMDTESDVQTIDAVSVGVKAKTLLTGPADEEPVEVEGSVVQEPVEVAEPEPSAAYVSYERRLRGAPNRDNLLAIAAEMDGDPDLTPGEAKALGKIVNELARK